MSRSARPIAMAILVATIGQLLVAALASGLPQFEGKAFGARLVAYPVLMLAPVAVWEVWRRARGSSAQPPWNAFALVMAPFLIDVTGNTLDLYDTVAWWDDANHVVNWFLLSAGVGLMLSLPAAVPRWVVAWLVAGLGAILAVAWELAEWVTFIRQGTELDTAYQDTLGDLVLGTLGAAAAAILVSRLRPLAEPSDTGAAPVDRYPHGV